MSHLYSSQLDAFSEYHKHQEAQRPRNAILEGPALPALGHAVAGSIGSAISNVAVYPLDLIITRLQVQRQLRKQSGSENGDHYYGVLDAIDKIYEREGGLAAFYTGVLQDTWKSVLDSFLFFLLYNYLRQRKLRARSTTARTLPVLDELNIGVISGALAKLVTTPISNVVTRKQTAAMTTTTTRSLPPKSKHQPLRTNKIVRDIVREKGWPGLWSGYSASLVLTLNPSITFFLYGFLKRALLPRTQRDNPGPQATFLLAAVSKAVASTITYPFSLAKTRAQVSSRVSRRATFDGATMEGKSSKNERDTKRSTPKGKSRNAFSMILEIVRTEGVSGLYDGLSGEVLKGFMSHGITMIVKESVHRFIIQAYYLILRALKRYPSPAELGQNISDKARDVSADISKQSQDVAATVKDNVARAASASQEKIMTTAQAGYDATKTAMETTRDKAAEALKQGSLQLQTTAQQAQEQARSSASAVYEASQDGLQRAKATVDAGKDSAARALKQSAQQAQSTTKQALEQARSGANQVYESSQDGLQRADSAMKQSKDEAASALDHGSRQLQDAAQHVQKRSQDAAQHVQERSQSAAQHVQEQSQSAAQHVQERSQGAAAKGYEAVRENVERVKAGQAQIQAQVQARVEAAEPDRRTQDPLRRATASIESSSGASAEAARRTAADAWTDAARGRASSGGGGGGGGGGNVKAFRGPEQRLRDR